MTNHPLFQLILARLREFFRELEALFWVYGFPLLLAIGLGIAFSSREPEPSVVDIQAGPETTTADPIAEQLKGAGLVVEVLDEAACRQRFRTGKTALFVVPDGDGVRFVYDQTRPESVLARYQVETALLRWKAGNAGAWEPEVESVTERGSRYIDFLIPGLIGLNLMGGGLWGVGFVLVDMRVRKLLKRLLATPMRRSHFLLSILGSRLLLMLPDMAVLVLVGCLGFGVPLRGDVLTLALVILVGGAAFAGIGLLIACRTEKTETVSGLMNLVMLPMWLLSGTFFSSKRFPEVAQPFIQALPLTQLNDALREVMLEGAGLSQVGWRIGILALWALITFALALRWFRWQ
jgi:ABC-2 type transport system permease protein